MREMKRLILGVMALTFLAGIGTGTWIQSLLAAPPDPLASVDRRVKDFEAHFDFTPKQVRLLRSILREHDARAAEIKNRRTAEQLRALNALEEESRDRIRVMLVGPQRDKYDKLIGRR